LSAHWLLTQTWFIASQALLEQVASLVQGWPSPQFEVHEHAPLLHTEPLPQTLPHPPQLLGSEFVFTSQPSAATPLQSANPELQAAMVHLLEAQAGMALLSLHTIPQAPQLLGSVCALTQMLLQSVCPGAHPAPH
jgi:hypothetical protein